MPPRLLVLPALFLSLIGSTAAQAGGVLVRLDADRILEGDVSVLLTPDDADMEVVVLSDDGEQPDVTAGDGRWAGAAHIPATEVSVIVRIGSNEFDGGTVSWSDANIPRDLDLSLRAGELTANAREANPHGDGAPSPQSQESTQGSSTPVAERTPTGPGDGLIMIAAGLLALLGVVALMLRARKRVVVRRAPVAGLTRLPPGGYAGPSSPALDDGLTYWQLPEDDPARLLTALVDQLSAHHSVLVVGPELPSELRSSGSAVYQCAPASPRQIGDYMEQLHADPRQDAVVVFFGVEQDATAWEEQDDELPIGSGGVALVSAATPESMMTHRIGPASGAGWRVQAADSAAAFLVPRPSA